MIKTKISTYCILFSLVLFFSCNAKTDKIEADNYTIKVTIDGLADGTKIVLKKQENNTTANIDSTIVKNEEFEFKGTIKSPVMYGIFIDSLQGRILCLVESGDIRIRADKNSIDAPVITGSKLNDELLTFKKGSEKIVSKINDLFIQIQKARAENDLEKINEINEKMRAINDENTQYSLDYAKNNPESFISSIVLQSVLRIPDINTKEINNIYTNFSDAVKKSEYSKNIARFIKVNTFKNDSLN